MTTDIPAVAGTITAALSPSEKRHLTSLERKIERGLAVFVEVGEALAEIRDQRLYRETHANFDSYCRERWGFERNRAYQLINAAEVARAIPAEFPAIANEAQARELVPLAHENPGLVAEVWKEVTGKDEPVSASRIRSVVRQHIQNGHGDGGKPTPQVSPTIKLVAAIDRAADLATAWLESRPRRADRNSVREAVGRLTEAVQ